MKTALGITRVSTDEQAADDRTSPASQRDKILTWCAANGYECLDVLDEVVSRRDELQPNHPETRPIFWSAWDRLERGEIQAIVFAYCDRFCAGLEGGDFPYWLLQSRKHGDGIRFCQDEPPLNGRFAPVIAAMTGVQGSADYEDITRRMRDGRVKHAEQGEFSGGALPLWIKWVPKVKDPDSGLKTKGYFELRPNESAVVLRIINLFESGQGSERIADVLSKDRVPAPSMRSAQWRNRVRNRETWDGASVLSILKNTCLKGLYQFGGRSRGHLKTEKQDPVEVELRDKDGKLLALITPEHFDAIQERLATNRRNGNSKRLGWPLAGLIHSEACNYRYSARADGRTGRRVYRCPARNARQRRGKELVCTCPPLPANEIEHSVLVAVRDLLKDKDAQRQAVGDYIASLEARKAILAGQLAPAAGDLKRIQKAIDDLSVAVSMDRLSRARYDDEILILEAERRRIDHRRDEAASAQRELQRVEESLADINAAVDDGLVRVAVWGHGKQALIWKDDEDPVIEQEAFADLARRLHLKVTVHTDGQIELTGLFPSVVLPRSLRARRITDVIHVRCARPLVVVDVRGPEITIYPKGGGIRVI